MKGVTATPMGDVLRPNATTRMTGRVINANVAKGDTVHCYYGTVPELTRIADMPAFSTDFWVNDDNEIYDFNNGKIRIRDGFTGEVIDESADAYDFMVLSGGGCCAYKVDSSTQTWKFYMQDGTSSGNILVPTMNKAAYRNRLVSVMRNGGQSQVFSYVIDLSAGTYTSLKTITGYASYTPIIMAPISSTSAMAVINVLGTQASNHVVYLLTTSAATTLGVWNNYHVKRNYTSMGFPGSDDDYFYAWARLYSDDDTTALDQWIVVRWSVDNYTTTEEIAVYTSQPTFYGVPTPYSSIEASVGSGIGIYDVSTMEHLYEYSLPTVSESGIIRENADYIWISTDGVYRKSAEGYVMYPTTEYPLSSPYGRLGYAVDDYGVGETATAIVLFSPEETTP